MGVRAVISELLKASNRLLVFANGLRRFYPSSMGGDGNADNRLPFSRALVLRSKWSVTAAQWLSTTR